MFVEENSVSSQEWLLEMHVRDDSIFWNDTEYSSTLILEMAEGTNKGTKVVHVLDITENSHAPCIGLPGSQDMLQQRDEQE